MRIEIDGSWWLAPLVRQLETLEKGEPPLYYVVGASFLNSYHFVNGKRQAVLNPMAFPGWLIMKQLYR